MVHDARYDRVADWYPGWVGDGNGFLADVGDLLPASLQGARVLDVACGHGRASRALARRGAHVLGVDISPGLIARACSIEDENPLDVAYRVADVAEPDHWWDGVLFDGATCEMAMMDIDDLTGTVQAVATTVRSGGWFALSMVHPCFPGNEAGLSSWRPDGSYSDEGWWTSPHHNPDGARIRVGSSHRTLSTYLNTLIESGFALERTIEPPAAVPTILMLRCRRA